LSDALIILIPTYGPWIIFGIVALESAGVPLPGETILVAAALLAATTGQISIVVVVLASAAGAIVGDGIGYVVGRRFGLPRSSLLRSSSAPRGGLTPADAPLIDAGLLFRQPGPALTKRQSPIDVSSTAIPRLPVSSSLVAMVPRTNIRSPRLRSGKIVFSDPKRVSAGTIPVS
jgi:hypothetical protein